MREDNNNNNNDEPPNRELYALLHVSPQASDEEIRKAYRQWAQIYHPDKQSPQVQPLFLFLLIYVFLCVYVTMYVYMCVFVQLVLMGWCGIENLGVSW